MRNRFHHLTSILVVFFSAALFLQDLQAQKKQKKQKNGTKSAATRADYQLPPSPLPVGEAGIMWYTTWETALAEAERSGRPIFFMAAAAGCSGISGVF